MTGSGGLGSLDLVVLKAVERIGGAAGAGFRRTSEVLDVLAAETDLGPRHSYPLLIDLAVPWRRHLPLLEAQGNLGSQYGATDDAADPRFTEVRLSRVGALALAAERGQTGPVPLDLIEGTLWAGGDVPPFAPGAVLHALRSGASDAGPPTTPTGGTVTGDVDGLLAGGPATLSVSCTVVIDGDGLAITEVPLGTTIDDVLQHVAARATLRHGRRHSDGEVSALADPPVIDVSDDTRLGPGVRLTLRVRRGADLEVARRWVLDIWPVTVEVEWRLPAPMAHRLSTWDRGDGSGLDALARLL